MELLFFHVQRALERVHAFFLIQRNREQDRFHGIVVALIGGRLGVEAGAAEEAVEKGLVFAAKSAAKFNPVRGGVVDQLNECRNSASHENFLYVSERKTGRGNFSPTMASLSPSVTANRETWSACARSCAKSVLRGVSKDVASVKTAVASGSGRKTRSASSARRNDTAASRSRTSSSKYKSGSAVTISTRAENFSSKCGVRASNSVN